MKMSNFKRISSLLLCLVLFAAMALTFTGCVDEIEETTDATAAPTQADGVIGEGEKSFTFTVIGVDGEEREFTVRTDKALVGEALTEVGLIAGEDSQYGLYVKTVNGITLDYDTDGKYWAFYINGEYAMTGVESTEIIEGNTYTFKAE